MGDIIEVKFTKRPATTLACEAYCADCEHSWIVVVTEGAKKCKCPTCGVVTVDLTELDSEETRWACSCGFDVFHVTNRDINCARCGENQASFYEMR
jgi:hypothetical protein